MSCLPSDCSLSVREEKYFEVYVCCWVVGRISVGGFRSVREDSE